MPTTLIGAGLAGSLMALFLARRGDRVVVYERRPDLRKTEISAGRSINLALANRGIHALEQVGIMDRIRPLLIPMAGRMIHELSGDLRFLPYGGRPEEVIYSVSRGGLNGILMDAAEETGLVSIEFEHTCRRVDLSGLMLDISTDDRMVRTSFHTLIGTDGSASAVRGAILSATKGQLHIEPLGHGYKELSIPPAEGGGFRMEKNALHIWPRGEYMLIALPNTDGSFTVTLFLPHEGDHSFAALDTPAVVRGFFEKQFPDAVPLMPDLDHDFFGNPTGHLDTIRCRPWHVEDVALIMGDAAHAIVPFHGQGMNCAFEDCSALDDSLRSVSDLAEAFAAFEQERKPNAEAIADMAIENYVEMRSSVLDPKFKLRKEVAFELERRHPDRFIPRYSMVMFHRIPYAEAKRRGIIQAEILDRLVADSGAIAEVDFELAQKLILERL